MIYDQDALIHDKKSFSRDTLSCRLDELGFNNLARMELFLWDLEMFLQIQSILQDKVVLKGGAAAQFYIPIDNQRTSIDIDMVCTAGIDEIEGALRDIERRFNGQDQFFRFRLHVPKMPKTDLPLRTYYMQIPSVCGKGEVFGGQAGVQEIKIEFFLLQEALAINSMSSPKIFAFETDKTYQVMSVDPLIGDKLTTLAVNTVGIPPERADEYVKQVYDVDSLITFNRDNVDFDVIKEHFIHRAESEATQRGIPFHKGTLFADIADQMGILSSIDFEKNHTLVKLINDFQSLYLRKTVMRSMAEWAIVGARLDFFLECLDDGAEGKKKMKNVLALENRLKFEGIDGEERGKTIRQFRDIFAARFEKYSRWPAKMLKGKHSARVLWEVVSPANIDEISTWIKTYFKDS